MIYFQRQVVQLLACKDGEIRTLQAENERLRAQIEQERARANRAIDEMLIERGSRPVTPTTVKLSEKLKSAMNEISSAGMEVGESK